MGKDFIREIIDEHNRTGRFGGKVRTRFPPEPNGYLHIGHAKAICINFGIASEYGGKCNLRYDDTNPAKEETEYVDSIKRDIRWLGFNWEDREFYASDYFEQLYEFAVKLIKKEKAYVCDCSPDEVREMRGTLTAPGRVCPHRSRTVEENLKLFDSMRKGAFADGSKILRAKIDMASGNINLRDPVMYRVLRAAHHRTGDAWCIYPTYDFTHGESDSIEGITHSICTLEFEDHRPLYDWFLDELDVHHPQQIEFARLDMTYTMMSKRKLLALVDKGIVSSWDDPRMPTLSGLRRRGCTAEAIRIFCDTIGIAKNNTVVDIELFEHCLRDDLNKHAARMFAVLRPLKVVITNYPQDAEEELDCINNPEDPAAGARKVPFSRELFIERDDFMEEPPKEFFRLAPGREVRLRYAYFLRCTDVIKDASGMVTELRCTYDPATKGGDAPDGRKVKSTLHWVSAKHAIKAEMRLYDRLFTRSDPNEGGDYMMNLNSRSLEVLNDCRIEPGLAGVQPGARFQFERLGYFCADLDTKPDLPVFNRTITLRDTWAKIQKKMKAGVG
ncbi:MAG TPA: glutamine--tRNA ligase/YqeY domain fusion protein [bacterium]